MFFVRGERRVERSSGVHIRREDRIEEETTRQESRGRERRLNFNS